VKPNTEAIRIMISVCLLAMETQAIGPDNPTAI
jgi:hypothetical protein